MDNSSNNIIYLLFGYQNSKRRFNTKLLGIYYTLEEIQKRQDEICLDESTYSIEGNITRDKTWTTFYRKYFYGDNCKELF